MTKKQEPTILGINKEGHKILGQNSTYLVCISSVVALGVIGLLALLFNIVVGVIFILFSVLGVWIVRKWLKPVTGSYWKNK